MTILKRFYVT